MGSRDMRHSEYFTPDEAREMARRDAALFCKPEYFDRFSPEDFARVNGLSYFLASNLWVLVTRDCAQVGNRERCGRQLMNLLRKKIASDGLATAIMWAKRTEKSLLRCRIDEREFVPTGPDQRTSELEVRISRLPLKSARQILLFLKRFTPYVPSEYSVHHADAIESFLQTDRFNKAIVRPRLEMLERFMDGQHHQVDRRLPRMAMIALIARKILREILGEFPGFDDNRLEFGTGAAACCDTAPIARYENIIQYGDFRPALWPKFFARTVHPWWHRLTKASAEVKSTLSSVSGLVPAISEMGTVPKAVDQRRLIAKETPTRMDRQRKVKRLMIQRAEESPHAEGLPFRDQESNKFVAKWGSYTDVYATHDASHASDSVTRTAVRLLFPSSWFQAFESCIPYAVMTDRRAFALVLTEAFATMGCGCTFPVETFFFYAIGLATTLVERHRLGEITLSELWRADRIVGVQSYGDDFEGLSRFSDAVINAFAFFGISTNRDKTYTHGPFRESCGAEWWTPRDASSFSEVEDVSVVYFPRSPLQRSWSRIAASTVSTWDDKAQERVTCSQLARVISLSRRLALVSPSAATWLATQVRASIPDCSHSFLLCSPPDEQHVQLASSTSCLHLTFVGQWLPRDASTKTPILRRYVAVGETPLPEGYIPTDVLWRWLRSAYGRKQYGIPAKRTLTDLLAWAARLGYVEPAVVRVVNREVPYNSGIAESFLHYVQFGTLEEENQSIPPLVIVSGSGSRVVAPSQWCYARPDRASGSAYLAARTRATLTIHIV